MICRPALFVLLVLTACDSGVEPVEPEPVYEVLYEVNVQGEVQDAVVSYTGPDGFTVVDRDPSFPFAERIELPADAVGVFRVEFQGQASEALVEVRAMAFRDGERSAIDTGQTEARNPGGVSRLETTAAVVP